MNSAYLSPTLFVNLFSLDQMQRSGATYGPDPLHPLTHVSISSSPSGLLLAHAALSSHNLLRVIFDDLRIASTLSPDTYHPAAFTATFLTPHINAEQRSRADAAEELHIDRSLCTNRQATLQHTNLLRRYSQSPTSWPLPPLYRRQIS